MSTSFSGIKFNTDLMMFANSSIKDRKYYNMLEFADAIKSNKVIR